MQAKKNPISFWCRVCCIEIVIIADEWVVLHSDKIIECSTSFFQRYDLEKVLENLILISGFAALIGGASCRR